MVNYVDIENTLIHLDTSYLSSMSDPLLPILLSKTALIEFSGWIEQSMDQFYMSIWILIYVKHA